TIIEQSSYLFTTKRGTDEQGAIEMNPFPYNDNKIDRLEFTIALPSTLIGIAALQFPNGVASVTLFSDGWISILLASIIFTIFAYLAVIVARSFPNEPFYTYTSYLLSRPIATMITVYFILLGIIIASFILRSLAFISQMYL